MPVYTKKIYFSGGDFHELEEVFRDLPGVVGTRTGYINAEREVEHEAVASGEIPAYMGIEVEFNPKKMDLSQLMDVLFAVTDPFSKDGQGEARGPMYRCGVFYADAEDEPQVELHLNFIANRGKPPAVSCVGLTMNDPNSNPKLARRCHVAAAELKRFQEAADEHQHYLEKHPDAKTFIDFAKLREYLRF